MCCEQWCQVLRKIITKKFAKSFVARHYFPAKKLNVKNIFLYYVYSGGWNNIGETISPLIVSRRSEINFEIDCTYKVKKTISTSFLWLHEAVRKMAPQNFN